MIGECCKLLFCLIDVLHPCHFANTLSPTKNERAPFFSLMPLRHESRPDSSLETSDIFVSGVLINDNLAFFV